MTMRTSVVVGMITATLMAVPAAAGQAPDSAAEREAVALVSRVEAAARTVRSHTTALQRMTGSPTVTRWSHYQHLDLIVATVHDDLRPAVVRLAELRPQLPAWKQAGIDRILAAARQLASDTSRTIDAKTTHQRRPVALNATYKRLVGELAMHAQTLATTANATWRYAEAARDAVDVGLPVGR